MTRDIEITQEQLSLYVEAQKAVQHARSIEQAIWLTIAAGHGLTNARIVAQTGTVLTVEVPDGGE